MNQDSTLVLVDPCILRKSREGSKIGDLTMIDPQAKPWPYIKLLAFVVVLGLISALITFAFVFLVNQATHLLWTGRPGVGDGCAPFTLLVCTSVACWSACW